MAAEDLTDEIVRHHDHSSRVNWLGRRTFLAGSLATAAGLGLGAGEALSAYAASPSTGQASRHGGRQFRHALSVSPFTEAVLAETALSDGDHLARRVRQVQHLFNNHGATEVYARIATKKYAPQTDAEHGWARGLERARLAASLDLPFNPEIGLFGNYGDTLTYQDPLDFRDYPRLARKVRKPWTSLALDEMLPLVRQYAATIARQILATGAHVNYWDLGNEVENGIAGVTPQPLVFSADADVTYAAPDAVDPEIGKMSIIGLYFMPESDRIAWSKQHLWPYLAQLFAAARDGIRSVDRKAKFSTHISLTAMSTPNVPLAFWETMRDYGYVPDMLGTSFYPTSGATIPGTPAPADPLAHFQDTQEKLHARFGKKVFIAEYAFASTTGSIFNTPPPGYGLTAADQVRFTRTLLSWGRRSGVLGGVRPWAPDYIAGEGSSGWKPLALFEPSRDGLSTAKPALDVF